MADERKDKAVQFVAKLLRLTYAGLVKWTPIASPQGGGETAFETTVDARTLRLYRYTYDGYVYDPAGEDPLSGIGYGYRNKLAKRTLSAVALEIVIDGYVTYTFRDVTGLSDLIDIASYKAAGADEFIEAVLAMNEKEKA